MTTVAATVDKDAKRTSGSIIIDADTETIFDLLATPARHVDFDGSGTVQQTTGGAERLALDSKFGMSMKFGPIPYRISNRVVEFDEGRLIAWQHFGKHRWRYELEPVDGGTKVTETFDWSTSTAPPVLELAGYPERHKASIDQTLARLKNFVEAS
jgi:hypothetical protein